LPYQADTTKIPGYSFFDSYSHPDMGVSLALTSDVFSSLHFGMNKLRDAIGWDALWKNIVFHGGVVAGDLLFFFLPPGYLWMHESFHRAEMTHMGLRSHINFAYPTGAYTMADMGGNIYTYDLPRMIEAGIESEYLLVEKLQRNNFFYEQGMINESLYWMANFQAWIYAYQPFLRKTSLTMMVEGEKQEVSEDSTQWAYYLFNPEEYYTADSENNQVIGTSDLKGHEKAFLKNRVLWSLVNFASPMMFGVRSIPLGDSGLRGNFALRQLYTSFGTDLSVNLYFKKGAYNMAFAYHGYMNYEHYFLAVEAELVDFPVQIKPNFGLLFSPRVLLGAQPKNQEFMTGDPEFLGFLGCRVDFAVSRHFFPYIDLGVKTDGWVAGNEYLERTISFKAGISVRF
jgi:hypothetical protein